MRAEIFSYLGTRPHASDIKGTPGIEQREDLGFQNGVYNISVNFGIAGCVTSSSFLFRTESNTSCRSNTNDSASAFNKSPCIKQIAPALEAKNAFPSRDTS